MKGTSALVFQSPTGLGGSFPLIPNLDREGKYFTSFQLLLLRRITALRQKLIETSNDPSSEDWFQDFRSMVSEAVSLIDMTLHQLYFKAQYDKLPGWKFDPEALGPRHGQRIDVKLGWVSKITGRHLDCPETKTFLKLKDLRNHLTHFDPPCFCYTYEEAAEWLNDVLAVGHLNLAIRRCASAEVTGRLVEFLLQPRVRFVPQDPQRPRLPLAAGNGYSSTSAEVLQQYENVHAPVAPPHEKRLSETWTSAKEGVGSAIRQFRDSLRAASLQGEGSALPTIQASEQAVLAALEAARKEVEAALSDAKVAVLSAAAPSGQETPTPPATGTRCPSAS